MVVGQDEGIMVRDAERMKRGHGGMG